MLVLPLLAGLAYADLFRTDSASRLDSASDRFFFDPVGSAPIFVFGVCALMLLQRRREIRAALSDRGSILPGVALLVPAVALYFWADHTSALDLLALSLILFALGAGGLIAGSRLARVLAPPLAVLLLAVPLPGVLLNQIVYQLQDASATLAAWILELLSIPVLREGDMLFANERAFEVIETCSGLRSMETLVLAAVAYSALFERRGWWAFALIGLAPAIAFLVNGGRIVSIVLNPGSEVVTEHTFQGIAALVSGVLVLHGVDCLLEFLARRRKPSGEAGEALSGAAEAHSPIGEGVPARAAGVAAVLAIMPLAGAFAPDWSPPPRIPDWPVDMPIEFGEFEARKLDLDRDYMGSVYFTRYIYRSYQADGPPVDVFVGWNARLQRPRSLLSPKVEIPGRGHERIEQIDVVEVDAGTPDIKGTVTTSQGKRTLSYHWYQGTGGLAAELLFALTARDSSVFRRDHGTLVVRIDTPIAAEIGGRAQAEERIRRFLGFVSASVQARDGRVHAGESQSGAPPPQAAERG